MASFSPSPPPSPPMAEPLSPNKVNLIDLAITSLSSTIIASRPITRFSCSSSTQSRLKVDGTPVTDIDGAAQRIICSHIRAISANVRIVGEESLQEVEDGSKSVLMNSMPDVSPGSKNKILMREAEEEKHVIMAIRKEILMRRDEVKLGFDDSNIIVDATRVSVFVDPLDGTSSYAKGDYEAVTTLVAVILDNSPVFGVIGKPFGHDGMKTMENFDCAAIYGGTLLGAAFIVGGGELKRSALHREQCHSHINTVGNEEQNSSEVLECWKRRKAIISKSRSGGVVQECINSLADNGLLHREPIHITGAGYKTMRLLLGYQEESLWFFPKPGTFLWDTAAADALLKVIGGKLSDKFGNDLDYSKSRLEASNLEGIVACSDIHLHKRCIQLFQDEKWDDS